MAALNRQQVAAGILTATAVLGLCSCTNDPGPTLSPSPTASVEQTVDPSPTASPTAEIPRIDLSTAEWPAEQEGYVFSDEPQGEAEVWLKAKYPKLWEAGVRSVTGVTIVPGNTADDFKIGTPGVTVQYIGGKRYEGTDDVPLTFPGTNPKPGKTSEVDFEARKTIASIQDPVPTTPDGRYAGTGMWAVSIIGPTHSGDSISGNQHKVILELAGSNGKTSYDGPTFNSLKSAIAWVNKGVTVPGTSAAQSRTIDPAEFSVSLSGIKGHEGYAGYYNPTTGKYVWIPAE